MNTLANALTELTKDVEKLAALQELINTKRLAVMKELRTLADRDRIVCVLTHKCNHPYNDQFLTDDYGNYVLYRGQNVSNQFDDTLVDNEIPKHLLIMKGAARKMPPIFKEKARATTEPYFYGAKVIRVRRVEEHVFKIYYDITANPPGHTPPRCLSAFYRAFHHKDKLKALVSNGFLPINLRFDQGIVLCNLFRVCDAERI